MPTTWDRPSVSQGWFLDPHRSFLHVQREAALRLTWPGARPPGAQSEPAPARRAALPSHPDSLPAPWPCRGRALTHTGHPFGPGEQPRAGLWFLSQGGCREVLPEPRRGRTVKDRLQQTCTSPRWGEGLAAERQLRPPNGDTGTPSNRTAAYPDCGADTGTHTCDEVCKAHVHRNSSWGQLGKREQLCALDQGRCPGRGLAL